MKSLILAAVVALTAAPAVAGPLVLDDTQLDALTAGGTFTALRPDGSTFGVFTWTPSNLRPVFTVGSTESGGVFASSELSSFTSFDGSTPEGGITFAGPSISFTSFTSAK